MKRQRIFGVGSTHHAIGYVLAGTVLVLVTGCKKEEIHAYRVPRESKMTLPSEVQEPAQQAALPHVIWTVPDSWQEVETTVSMRKATLKASNGQEIAITAFPGDVGGLLANVNRWRGQVGLDPTDEQGLEEFISRLDGVDVIVVDVTGETTRLIGSIINVGDGQTWFAKAMGQSDSLDEIKDDLVSFSSTFHIHDHGEESASEDQATPDQGTHTHDDAEDRVASEPAAHQSGWEQPEEWTAEESASSILMVAFLADSGARITVTSLVGDGGGVLGNINRWRGQLDLPMVSSLDEQPVSDLGNDAVYVDLTAIDEESRMVAGIVPFEKQTLFFKLTGTASAVETELERFVAYILAEGVGRKEVP